MKGLEIAEAFYREHGERMLSEQFPALSGLIAVGLCGSGSECFGYDDAISRDHDFEPGFCIFLPDEDLVDRRTAFLLERAYAALPHTFMGLERSRLDPVGGNRHGVIRMSEFFRERLGTPDGVPTEQALFFLPEQAIAEVTNGRIFYDGLGVMSAVRDRLAYFPEDVRLKKLAGCLLLMGQSGQYNYPRCIARGETGAAQLALAEFVRSALHAAFLINRKYLPYYKWSFYALRTLPRLSEIGTDLERLISTGNTPEEVENKRETVERVTATILSALREDRLLTVPSNDAERQAYAVNDRITDPTIRNLHILYGV